MIAQKAQHMSAVKDKVQVLQRKLYVVAKKEPKRTFGVLYDKIHRMDILERAWKDVRQNKGSAGIDKVSIEEVENQGVKDLLKQIQEELKEGTYRPMPVKRVFIPKPGKQKERRPLGIPTVKERIVQAAAKIVLEPLFEASFLNCSYGFRPKRNAQQAHAEVQKAVIEGYREVIDFDLKSYFNTIPHDRLLLCIQKRVRDPKVLRLIKGWLKAGILDKTQYEATTEGVSQGSPLSPLLSNAYLHVIDKIWSEKYPETKIVRFADDLRVLCKKRTSFYVEKLRSLLSWHGLKVNEEKSGVIHARKGFDFLGQHFRLKPSRKWKHWQFCYRWPSKKAMTTIKEKIKGAMGKDDIYSLETKIAVINPIVRGWCQFHKYSNAHKHFQSIDAYVYTKFVRFMHRKHRWRGSGYRKAPRSFFEKLGLYHLHGKIQRWPLKART